LCRETVAYVEGAGQGGVVEVEDGSAEDMVMGGLHSGERRRQEG
jgi:hypothetical protein